ncbi:MAG: hypothetical protein ACKVH0_15005 [Alphaproteobacteria bacterium]
MEQLGYYYLAHADWSVDPKRRRIATARRCSDGWVIEAATLVGALDSLVTRIEAQAGGKKALLGVDLPIGVPAAWANMAGVTDLLETLPHFGSGIWQDFFSPAAEPSDISIHRPFYPARGRDVRQAHLIEALGVKGMDALRRLCDFDENGKRSGTPIFWTMGPAQVGKAALNFWRDVLQPALVERAVTVWPFDGGLKDIANRPGLSIAEAYPGEIYHWFDLEIRKPSRRKGRQADRALDADRLLDAGAELGARFTEGAEAQIRLGFPDGGDDSFDAMVGLLGLLAVVKGHRLEYAPDTSSVRQVEGWILGRRPGDIGNA